MPPTFVAPPLVRRNLHLLSCPAPLPESPGTGSPGSGAGRRPAAQFPPCRLDQMRGTGPLPPLGLQAEIQGSGSDPCHRDVTGARNRAESEDNRKETPTHLFGVGGVDSSEFGPTLLQLSFYLIFEAADFS